MRCQRSPRMQRGDRVEQQSARTSHAYEAASSGNVGASCFDAHQTTAASATSEKMAWMSAKRRFMKGLGARTARRAKYLRSRHRPREADRRASR